MFIEESFLSFLWQHAYFDTTHLKTTRLDTILIRHPGYRNMHAGPDFLDCRIRIGTIDWAGSVEIHVKSSDWMVHGHSGNPDYNKVVLHVVWRHDVEIRRTDGTVIPTLEISKYVSNEVTEKYSELMCCESEYPCHPYLPEVKRMYVHSMMGKAVLERLERKSESLFTVWIDAAKDWEETSYRTLVRNFGFKVNQENMYVLAKLLPFRIISRHRSNGFQLEALLFGMAGFLEKPSDRYAVRLKSEFEYLRHKYSLHSGFLRRYHWKFLRMRLQNFPTIRLAQLAALLSRLDKIFSLIIGFSSVKEMIDLMSIRQSIYWLSHYDFGKKYRDPIKGLGKASIQNILINTFTTILTAYSRQVGNELYLKKAIHLLESLPPEDNHLIRNWKCNSVRPDNALESQGLIELSNTYCCKKKCLICEIGTHILMKKA